MSRFPKPYINNTRVDRSLMEYVPFENTSIGSRKSGTPKSVKKDDMNIEHVGGTAGGAK